jgi:hypothetical protein
MEELAWVLRGAVRASPDRGPPEPVGTGTIGEGLRRKKGAVQEEEDEVVTVGPTVLAEMQLPLI